MKRKLYGKEYIGKNFGHLTILNIDHGKALCQCDCGNKKWIVTYSVIKGKTRSCGCLSNILPFEDLTGRRFGKLTVIKHAYKNKARHYWLCRCDCGNEKTVATDHLIQGKVLSCGCYNAEKNLANIKTLAAENFKEGTSIAMIKSSKLPTNNTSGHRGVSWDGKRKKWIAAITFRGEKIYLGGFSDIDDAVAVRKAAEEKYFKPVIEKYKGGNNENNN